MKTSILVSLFFLFFACQRKQHPSLLDTQNAVIKDVTIINLKDSSLLAHQDIWIQAGKIDAIKPTSKESSKGIQIDGKGKYVMLGLADMHVHLPSDSLERQCFLLQQLLAGVTYVRSMRGEANHIPLRQAIQKGEYVGPDLYLASQPIRRNLEMTPEEVDALVQEFKKTGYDAIKVLSVADSTTFEALVRASKKYSLPLCGHVPRNIGLETTLDSDTYTSIEHLGGYYKIYAKGQEAVEAAVLATAKAGVYNCATLDYYTASTRDLATLQQQAGLQYVTKKQLEEWETAYQKSQAEKTAEEQAKALDIALRYKQLRLFLIKALYEAKAPLLLSPDATGIYAVPGFSLLREMQLHEEAGIPPLEVLRMATHTAAQFVGKENYGGVEQGQKANLVLLEANPLEKLEHLAQVVGVYCNGQWHSKAALEQQLAALRE